LKGFGKDLLPKDESNVVWKMMERVFKRLNRRDFSLKNLRITIESKIPFGSGLGSSASAIAGGLALGTLLSGQDLNKEALAQEAADIEGHPDNALPAIFGGLCLCYKNADDKYRLFKPANPKLKTIIVNPAFQVSTDKARKTLPKKYPVKDIVFNLSRASLLSAAFLSKRYGLLRTAVEDKIHQPFRAKNIAHAFEIFDAGYKADALAVFISGSGPSIAAFAKEKDAKKVSKAMMDIWLKAEIEAKSFILDFDDRGLEINRS
jgi:homoserine kinase